MLCANLHEVYGFKWTECDFFPHPSSIKKTFEHGTVTYVSEYIHEHGAWSLILFGDQNFED